MSVSSRIRSSVLVTGAASGIGLAVAGRAAQFGYRVVLLDQDGEALEAAIAGLEGHGHVTSCCDVRSLADLQRAVREQADAETPLRSVVASAGIEVLGTVLELEPEQWERSLSVNLTGVFNTAKASMPSLVETGGAFVAISSDAGVVGAQGYSAYCAAKHGVVGLVKAMALDYGSRGVRSNVVAPSFVQTPMADRIFEGNAEEMSYFAGTVPLGRFARPDEVAAAAIHLIGEDASYANGMVYRVDGGSTAGYFIAPQQ